MTPFTRMEIYEGPDREGKCHFALFWVANYHPGHPDGEHRIVERGQHFHARLKDYSRKGMEIIDHRRTRP